MATEPLPKFKYHPDPLATGSIKPSDKGCVSCIKPRGYVYTGPTYGEETYEDEICPWCIASGRAHEELEVTFHDEAGVGGEGEWEEVPEKVVTIITQRTPGFTAWQQEKWWTHCGDAAQFLGRAGKKELEAAGQQAIDAIRESAGFDEGDDAWDDYLDALDKDGGQTAYLFRCGKCGQFGGYCDAD